VRRAIAADGLRTDGRTDNYTMPFAAYFWAAEEGITIKHLLAFESISLAVKEEPEVHSDTVKPN